jgi:hypothetical protein
VFGQPLVACSRSFIARHHKAIALALASIGLAARQRLFELAGGGQIYFSILKVRFWPVVAFDQRQRPTKGLFAFRLS